MSEEKKRLLPLVCGFVMTVLGLLGLLWAVHPAGHSTSLSSGIEYYEGDSEDSAVILAPKGTMDSSPILKGLLKQGISVLTVDAERAGITALEAVELLQEQTEEYAAPVLIGYDTGASVLLKSLDTEDIEAKAVVLLAPILETESLKSPIVSGGMYQVEDSWLENLSKMEINQPIFLLTGSSDERFTTTEATILYNALSGAEIFRVGGHFIAEQEDVRLAVVNGAFHSYLPFNRGAVQQTAKFLSEKADLDMNGMGTAWQLAGFLRILTVAGLVICLTAVGNLAKEKNNPIAAESGKVIGTEIKLIGTRILTGLISLPLACIVLLFPVPQGAGLFAGIFIFISLLEGGILFLKKRKEKKIQGNIQIVNVPDKQDVYGFLLTGIVLIAYGVLLFTGVPHGAFSWMDIVWGILLTILFLLGFLIRHRRTSLLYMAASYVPFLLAGAGIFLIKGQSRLLVFLILLPCLLIIDLLGRGLKELFNNKWISSAICSVILTLTLLSFGGMV